MKIIHPPDWNKPRPWHDGSSRWEVEIDVESASRELEFTPVVPAALGTPRVFCDGVSALRLSYEPPPARFVVFEDALQLARPLVDASLERTARRATPDNCEGELRLVMLADGSRGLVQLGPASTSITFTTARLHMLLHGPPGSLSVREITRLADAFVREGTTGE